MEKQQLENLRSLDEVQKALADIVVQDKARWTDIYLLMDKVDREKLFEEAGYRSFTAWVNATASQLKVQASLLWARKKAGQFYVKYAQAMEVRGHTVKALDDVNVPAENLTYVEKISQGDVSIASDLIAKLEKGELNRRDLRNAWCSVRTSRAENGLKNAANGYEKRQREEELEVKPVGLTALNVVNALTADVNGMDGFIGESIPVPFHKQKVGTFTEFAINTGTSRHQRRMDFVVFENKTLDVSNKNELRVHGVEIKVSKHDLLGDTKMAEYVDFVDCFWLAIPNNDEIVEAAKSVMLDGWGLLAVDDDGKVHVINRAEYRPGVMRLTAINNALLQLLPDEKRPW